MTQDPDAVFHRALDGRVSTADSRSPDPFDAISGRLSWLVVVRPDFHVLPPHVASVVAICVLKQHQPMVPQVYPSDVYD